MSKVVKKISALRPGPNETLSPFLFCVYHKDNYPAGNKNNMNAPRRGDGQDFNPAAPYRMYHGETVPGFPQHPHRGFETVTATLDGIIDHTDSMGNGGRYGQGDLQWMTAGKGVVHGEMFPLVYTDKPNTLRLFQLWFNLPAKDKMVEPDFAMHWHEEQRHVASADGKTKITVWAGELEGKTGLPPTRHSYANDKKAEVAIWLFSMKPGGEPYNIPPAKGGSEINRMLYFVEGTSVNIGGSAINQKSSVVVDAGQACTISNTGSDLAEVLLLQGKAINEPVAQHGPFVMNTREEIQKAFSDYQATRFGGWPWPEDDYVFPRDKGRFALLNKKEIFPPAANAAKSEL